MNGWITAFLVMIGIEALGQAYMHGKPKKNPNYNFFMYVLNVIVILFPLYMAGVFE